VQNARRLTFFIQAATHGKARAAIEFRRHPVSLPDQNLLV
jgi:hypothetical protein